MPTPDLNIFTYKDFRLFLGDYHRARKALDGKFSHRLIKEKMGVSSAGWFADVVKGRINLTTSNVVKLGRLLGLKPTQADYFEAMVNYGQAMSLDEKNHHFHKMISFQEVKADLVGMDRIEFYSKWFHSALRELLLFHRFHGTSRRWRKSCRRPSARPRRARASGYWNGWGLSPRRRAVTGPRTLP